MLAFYINEFTKNIITSQHHSVSLIMMMTEPFGKIPCFCLRRYDHREKINCLFQLQQYDTGHKSVYWMNVKCESKQTDVPYRWICNDNRFFIIQSLADPIKYGHFFLDSDEGKWKLMKFSRWP